MKFDHLKAPVRLECWGEIGPFDAELEAGPVRLGAGRKRGQLVLMQRENSVTFSAQETHHASRLEQLLSSGAACLATVLMVKGRSLQIAVRGFHSSLLQFTQIGIGFDEDAIRICQQRGVRGTTPEDVLERLQRRLCYQPERGGPIYIVLQTEAVDQQPGAQLGRRFAILGEGYQLPVAEHVNDDGDSVLRAGRLSSAGPKKDQPLRLAVCEFSLLDHTRVGQLRPLAKAAMSRLTQVQGSYFRAWDEYGALEGALLLQRARSVGVLRAVNAEAIKSDTRFFLEQSLPQDIGTLMDALDIVPLVPSYLEDPALDWETYCDSLSKEQGPRGAPPLATARVVGCNADSVTLNLPYRAEFQQCTLILSLQGDLEQIKRRARARQRILEGRSANPLLGQIIEKDGDLPRAERPPHMEEFSPLVMSKVFRKEPTGRQQQAIRWALNTPDIMVIQGPPGTGKTTVITAIIERLNEERDKRQSGKGSVLITAHQHDAVDNVLSRLRVDARPAIKFGHRGGAGGAGGQAEDWTEALAQQVRDAHPQMRRSELQLQLAQQASTYMAAPSLVQALALVRHIVRLPATVLDAELAERARALLQDLVEVEQAVLRHDGQVLRALYALRTTPAGFADDGAQTAGMALLQCRDMLDEQEQALLAQMVAAAEADAAQLRQLAGLKQRLLGRYCKPPPFRFDKPRDDVLMLLAQVSRALEQHEQAHCDPVAAILADFVHELEGDPTGVSAALGEYSFVFAATCQGADRNEIQRAKRGRGNRDGEIEYDTVIIDEAARVSPRDLLIPMAQGARRIILVGDHRQLPHIVEDDIIRNLEADNGAANTALLQQSAFQYLRDRAIELTRRDGIERTVTLDRQYRMHSLLGRFVSEQFYAAHGEGFDSLDDNSRFAHELPDVAGHALAWLEVPPQSGREVFRPPSSWYREAEASRIVERLDLWMSNEHGKKMSFGIITFYRAQVEAIFQALAAKGYAERTPANEWTIAPAYREKIGDVERLRVGTVDAFQGMEFDVVFLSIVRSSPPARNGRGRPEKAGGVFGRLQTESLQCVGMSRQKSLLVVAGDSGLLDHPLAEQAVPALCALRRLCLSAGVTL